MKSFFLVVLALCSSQVWAGLHDNVLKLAQANDAFSLRLLQSLEQAELDKSLAERNNIFVSPFSIGSVLAMLLAGAVNQTYAQIYQTLGLNQTQLNTGDLFASYKTLIDALNSRQTLDSSTQLDIANAIACQKDFALNEDFLNNITTFFESQVFAEDFTKQSAAATKEINEWVSDKTNGKIAQLFTANLPSNTAIVLLNAIYFKGVWKTQFSKDRTLPNFFFNPDDQGQAKPTVQLMSMKAEFKYAEWSDGQMIELPYHNETMAMYIFLPPYGQNQSISAQFTAAKLETRMSQLARQTVTLELPKFKLEQTYQLASTLEQMGIRDALNGSQADFSAIDSARDLFISQVIHKTHLEVNEEGSEAAAATGLTLGGDAQASMSELNEINFRADHPFLFLIQDRASAMTLFAGIVNNPNKTS